MLLGALALGVAATPQAPDGPPSGSQDWRQFRGPGGRGIAVDPVLPTTWSATDNIVWSATVPGMGWSSPIVTGDLIVVTSVVSSVAGEEPVPGLYFGGERPAPTDPHRWVVYAHDVGTGELRWETELHAGIPDMPRHLKNSYASETPVTDGKWIYVYFGNVGLFALDMDGEVLWERRWPRVQTRNGWGTAASPALHKGRLYIVNDNDDQSFMTAVDAVTGEDFWTVLRDEGTNWATPFIWENEQRTEVVTSGTDRVRSYDLDGKLLWGLGGMSSITIPTPFTEFGLLYLASGYVGDEHRPVYAIRPGASGDIPVVAGETSNDHVAWSLAQGSPYNPTPLVYGDQYYTLYDRGFMTAHDARTGEEIYDKRRISAATAYTTSPWAYNDRIFVASEDGDTYVLRAGEEFEVLGVNSLDEMIMATPAMARGSLFLRTASRLYRIAEAGS
ncbi:MAG TPA: PQQ-binding-like beta-propeller repeat protein [Acidobacteriota bacterium]|nr:PQQ-binding-like beta-propeller repeat protein [Acidobacteriota bacterium]